MKEKINGKSNVQNVLVYIKGKFVMCFGRIIDNYVMCVGHILDNYAMYVWSNN
jgi:hypothetical protein